MCILKVDWIKLFSCRIFQDITKISNVIVYIHVFSIEFMIGIVVYQLSNVRVYKIVQCKYFNSCKSKIAQIFLNLIPDELSWWPALLLPSDFYTDK